MEVACTRSAVELLDVFCVTAGGRMLQRYGVLEGRTGICRESAPRGEVYYTRSAVELLGLFRVIAEGRMLQRYGVLEEAGRESAAAWSRRAAMVEQKAGI